MQTGPAQLVGSRTRNSGITKLRMADGETQPKKKVVVTGLGVISAVGCGTDSFFTSCIEGKSGIARLPKWADEYPCQVRGC